MSRASDRLQGTLSAIARSAEIAGRNPAEVQLIAVSKGRSAEAIEELIEAGQRDFGENRVQEAAAKWPALMARYPEIRLHGIGRLQSNNPANPGFREGAELALKGDTTPDNLDPRSVHAYICGRFAAYFGFNLNWAAQPDFGRVEFSLTFQA